MELSPDLYGGIPHPNISPPEEKVGIKTKVKGNVRLRGNDKNMGILPVGDGFVGRYVGVQIFCCWNTIEKSWDQIERSPK